MLIIIIHCKAETIGKGKGDEDRKVSGYLDIQIWLLIIAKAISSIVSFLISGISPEEYRSLRKEVSITIKILILML